jgi:hypothetical protein
MPRALINGQSYSWSTIKVNILGVPAVGISKISYKEKQNVEDIFGAGNRPVARGYGNIETEGSITIHMNELEPLQDASPDGTLMGIPEFDIVVAFLPVGGKVVTHTLKNVRLKGNGRDAGQGVTNIEEEIELAIGEIIWK